MTTFITNNAVDLPELSSPPAAPDEGRWKLYFGTDNFLYAVDSEGNTMRFALAEDSVPLIDPAVAGNLVTQAADGTLVDAGYAASESVTAGTVVKRRPDGQIWIQGTARGIQAIGGTSEGIYAGSALSYGGYFGSNVAAGGKSSSLYGTNHHEFGEVSAIRRDTGALAFLGASAAANRNAQLVELFQSIPTSDPAVAGRLWLDGDTVKISSG